RHPHPFPTRRSSELLAAPALHTTDAYWPDVTWRVALGEAIAGALYSDTGEGAVNGESLTLFGRHDGQRLTVTGSSTEGRTTQVRSEAHTSELQSREN